MSRRSRLSISQDDLQTHQEATKSSHRGQWKHCNERRAPSTTRGTLSGAFVTHSNGSRLLLWPRPHRHLRIGKPANILATSGPGSTQWLDRLDVVTACLNPIDRDDVYMRLPEGMDWLSEEFPDLTIATTGNASIVHLRKTFMV
jgi:hypothetical protein